MAWPYEFLTLNAEEKAHRRDALDHYAAIAHWSAYLLALLFLLCRGVIFIVRRIQRKRRRYETIPGSPNVKFERLGPLGQLSLRWAKLSWWMGDDVYFLNQQWGQKDEWVLGLAWTAWLLSLCVRDTGKDYLHLTKRFGIVAVSQIPVQFVLGFKILNPFAFVFRSSHEQVNRYHRVLGRIIYVFILIHVFLYNVFFVFKGIWFEKFFSFVVLTGVVALLFMHLLFGTATRQFRSSAYQIFFITHIVSAVAIPLLIFWHAPSSRFYIFKAMIALLIDTTLRKFKRTVSAPTTVETVPGTNLLKISATLPQVKMVRYQARPGAHVYLNLPPASRPSSDLKSWDARRFGLIYNPFTVSSINPESNTITLVARSGAGPLTSHLNTLSTATTTSVKINVEGPYGAIARTLPGLLKGGYDRIILFAGGVGATFALPVYRAILKDNSSAKVRLVWAIRSAADATWAFSAGNSVMDDDNVEMYITSDMNAATDDSASEVLLEEMGSGGIDNHRRPDVARIVHETFQAGREESVAVLVCGPAGMVKDVRDAVRIWAMRGRKVWWHSEAFGW